jgi:hypothetical protein
VINMHIKNRLNKLERMEPVQGAETLLKIIPGGAEYYRIENGKSIRIEEAEYSQHITRQVKAGPININVRLPEAFNT